MSQIIKGQKWRYIGPDSEFYTRGKVYEVIAVAASRGDMLQMTDNLDDRPHHWTEESMSGLFERAEGPVRTVTIKEIVSGYYGHVKVAPYDDTRVFIHVSSTLSADELRAAAATLTEIADALGEAK